METEISVYEYLESLPQTVLNYLFQSPASCLAIYRLLPPLAKLLISTMLFSKSPLKMDTIDSLVKSHGRRRQSEAIQKLRSLHIARERFQAQTLVLNSAFKKSLTVALTGGEDLTKSFGVPCDTPDPKHPVTVEFLDNYATKKWEAILHYMVGMNDGTSIGQGVLILLKKANLMTDQQNSLYDGEAGGSNLSVPRRGSLSITSTGFKFLLRDLNRQIWTLLLQYLNMADELQMNPVEVLNFIFMMGALEVGKDYSMSALSDTQRIMVEDLRDYGIVYVRKTGSKRFYPTKLAACLTADPTLSKSLAESMQSASSSISADESSDFIIIETNFKIYAYTSSPLQIAVLDLFVELKARFANMVIGQITRESVRWALKNGITADQIISFLTTHAHPFLKQKDPVLPPTVVDQIKLWQIELDRITAVEGFLYFNFKNQDEYNLVANYAATVGVLVWQNPAKRKCFVTEDGNQQVMEYVNRKSREAAAEVKT